MNRSIKQRALQCLSAAALFVAVAAASAANSFSFAVIGHPFKTPGDESALRQAIAETDADNLAFVVANGIKSGTEPCSDTIYNQRKALFDGAQNGLIVSVAGSDWSECRYANGRSAAVERLNHVRDLFFSDDFSLGASKIPLIRQSATRKFRGFGENARWELENVLFATIDLPANNNRYLAAAGRNSEFEDRLLANRNWLQRLATLAALEKMQAIVLFCDGDPIARPGNLNGKHDGFEETRQQIVALTKKFAGKILIVHGRNDASMAVPNDKARVIVWRANLGDVNVGSGWIKLTVSPSSKILFAVESNTAETKTEVQ